MGGLRQSRTNPHECKPALCPVGYMVPGAGVEPACLAARNFKSRVYTNFTTRAVPNTLALARTHVWHGVHRISGGLGGNRTRACRFCRPKRYHFATRPMHASVSLTEQFIHPCSAFFPLVDSELDVWNPSHRNPILDVFSTRTPLSQEES